MTVGRDGSDRIVVQAATYTAKYRDGQGVVREHATGCRDRTAAHRELAELVRRAELVKAGVVSAAEDAVADQQTTLLADHVSAYLDHLEAADTSSEHRSNVRRCLNRIAAECGFHRLSDLRQAPLKRWLAKQKKAGMAPRTRNVYRAAAVAFCNWCIESERLTTNPFSKTKKADEKVDRRRERRAMTEEELVKLLEVAGRRPVLDAMTMRTGKRRGQAVAKLRDGTQRRLESLGRERALIYKTFVLTGLRKKELTLLTVGQLDLDGDLAFVTLKAADEKSREGNGIALRADLAAELRQWLDEKLEAVQDLARRRNEPIPARLPSDTRLFRVPRDLVKILDRDLKLAGIPKVDDRGRTLDVHALRHSFSTLLSKGGVAPRTAQAAMRHSSIELTMNTYTDPNLLDVHEALNALPSLPLDDDPDVAEMATGTDGALRLAPVLAPTPDVGGQPGAIAGNVAGQTEGSSTGESVDVTAAPVKRKQPLTSTVNGCPQERAMGFEPTTSSLGS